MTQNILVSILILALAIPASYGEAAGEQLKGGGDPCGLCGRAASFGFVLRSRDFGAPCTEQVNLTPSIYDNDADGPIDISFQVFNTGGSNLFVLGTGLAGFVIPPQGPMRRPRIMRMTLQPGESVRISGQNETCRWIAAVRPH